jgi:hypothetical protein
MKCYIWGTALRGAETWTFRKAEKFLESFELWFWRRTGKISWTNCVKN